MISAFGPKLRIALRSTLRHRSTSEAGKRNREETKYKLLPCPSIMPRVLRIAGKK